MEAPAYGWLTGLTNYMNAEFGDAWAYSGSFAMYCIAAVQNKECRAPGDIDILTSDVPGVAYKLRSELDGNLGNPPGPKTRKCTIKGAKLYINGITPYAVNIDILAAETQFGDLNNVQVFHQGTTILRVASLASLKRSKRPSSTTMTMTMAKPRRTWNSWTPWAEQR